MTLPALPPWANTVHHDGSEQYVSALTPQIGETVRVALRVGANAPVRRIYLRAFPNGEQTLTPMTAGPMVPPARWFEARLTLREPVTHYRFLLLADDGVWWMTAAGLVAHEPLDSTDFRIVAGASIPEWLAGAVFYQIFPDSFANGDPTNDPQPGDFELRGERPITLGWGDPLPPGRGTRLAYYGGDLQGIIQKLDYLADLGVTALYLNPIFTAFSVHRYDVTDYERVDPHLGGEQALIALRAALDERGMRLILDMVPNHCGSQHRWFLAAQADPHAPEAEFFTFYRHPDKYANWLGHNSLPKLNYQSAELRRRMYEDADSILRRWLREPYHIDGWRIDVGNMLGRQDEVQQLNAEVARGIRQAVKTTRPDAYLIAENFYDASPQLQGDQWDGEMNYLGLTLPLWHWLRGYVTGAIGLDEQVRSPVPYPTAALETTWRLHRAAIPWITTLQQYNLLDSHDTWRIRSIVGGSDALHRLAVVIQMTLPGVPGIYYGDEIGMMNVPRPHDGARGAMIWDEERQDRDLWTFYRQIIALRKESRVLQRGGLQVLAVEPDLLAYQREGADGRALVIAQRSADPRPASPLAVAHGGIADGTCFREVFSGQRVEVTGGMFPLPELPQGATLWMSET